MSTIDVNQLLFEVSAESLCGEDLEYDAAMLELQSAAEGTPDQQIGDTVVEAEEPDWGEVKRQGIELFARTKDLRVCLHLTRALLKTDGFDGLRDALAVTHGLLEQYWAEVHPQLDPDDNDDPTMRINILVGLCDPSTMLDSVRRAPLVDSRSLGRFGLRDISLAKGDISLPEGSQDTQPDPVAIDGAFMDADVDVLQATADALREGAASARGIENCLNERLGLGNAPDLSALPQLLDGALAVVDEQLARRGIGAVHEAGGSGEDATAAGGAPRAISGEVASRDDVVRMLDKIIAYYERQEPTSPVPLLMERAKRLIHMTFMEVIQDMAPDAISQVETIRGPREES